MYFSQGAGLALLLYNIMYRDPAFPHEEALGIGWRGKTFKGEETPVDPERERERESWRKENIAQCK